MRPIITTAWLLVALIAGSACASETLVITTSGYYLLKQDANGVPHLERINQVITMGDAPQPNPPQPQPPENPQDPFQKLQVKANKEAVKLNDPTTAKALGEVYRMVADRVEKGSLAFERSFDAVAAASDAVLRVTNGTDKWQPWRDTMSDELVTLKQTGRLATQADHVKALRSIQTGLSTQAEELGERINWERLLKLIELILEILIKFK